MSDSAPSAASRSRILACTVTSSAVVGSSAMIKLRAAAQRHRDHRALALAARQRERIGARHPLGIAQLHMAQQLDRLRPGGRLREAAMQPERLGDLRADAMQRVERGHRLLEDHRDAVAANLAHLGLVEPDEIAPLEAQRAGDMGAFRQQAHQRERGHGLARTGFSHDAERLARAQRERHVAHHSARSLRRGQVDGEIGDLEQHLSAEPAASGSSASRKPSPIRLRPSTLSATASPGKSASRGATYIQVCASASMRPQDDERRLRAEPEVGQRGLGENRDGELDRRLNDQRGRDIGQHMAVARSRPARAPTPGPPARIRARVRNWRSRASVWRRSAHWRSRSRVSR